ncbi:SDR family NAD(P)-dependent oxidoreductase [Pseudomonas sp. RIT-PI-S]|uniref:SDR family NAD(P)-dependent oxidoreductase n=1 Tax=Pseudomonas sp. RIT-PI-S TaxID=3035295 RepID=UPI0021D8EE98|nr:SDR family NAD(P)-dependent oxidoreductase [Pseudomonas sp. RIT-PI-S]
MSKVWFVTGAGRGIGAEIVRSAIGAGDRVIATGRNLAQLRTAFQSLPADRLILVELDVSQASQAKPAVKAALSAFGRIDVLVNNAGYGLLGHFEETPTADIEQQFAVNVFGLMHVLRAVLPVMRGQRAGHVINISSVGGVIGFSGASVYCATKYAIEGLTASLGPELEPFGIKTTVVEPGFFRTEFLDPVSVKYGTETIDDYAARGTVEDAFRPYQGKQQGDPAKLGAVIVQLAAMAVPPKQFLAGSDALAMATVSLETRSAERLALAELSASTDGAF